MSTEIKIKNKPKIKRSLELESPWQVILFNCYCHTYDEVIEQIMLALKCGSTDAFAYTDTAEIFGSVTVYRGSFADSIKIASVLGSTGLDVRTTQ